MKKFDPIFLKIFLFGFPVVAMFAIFSYFYSMGIVNQTAGYAKVINNLAGLVFAMWMALSLYLCVRLMVSGLFRDQVIAKITFIRERDEREAILTGKATKTTFLTTLALLILLFCLSCFQVSVYRVPMENAVDGKTGIVSLGVGLNFIEHGKQAQPADAIPRKDIFSYQGLPISSTTVVIMLIFWQIVSYNYSMRRLMK